MQIGPYSVANRVMLAPMAGVTDRPFRQLCRELGAGWVVGEMLSANPALWETEKSRRRRDHSGEPGPIVVQIAGADAAWVAEAAQRNVAAGADVIDINMGCPAKKVCQKAAGSALLCDEPLVAEILAATVLAVNVPVTLKIRTGPDPARRNGLRIARIAEDAGIAALAVHGRTRADKFAGHAEYDSIAAIKQSVRIPVIANGDITTPEQAAAVLRHTGADAVMLGRAALGNPWIFREINHYLASGRPLGPPSAAETRAVLLAHVTALHRFYGDYMGLRVARKHIGWYLDQAAQIAPLRELRARLFSLECPQAQLDLLSAITADFDGAALAVAA